MTVLSSTLDAGSSVHHEFRDLLTEYARFLSDAGTPVEPFTSPTLPLFSALAADGQRSAIEQVRRVLEVFREVTTAGGSLRDTPTLLWRSLRQLGFKPCSDIFGKMRDTDVVVVYSLEQRQVFQNLRFFEIVTICLEELYCSEWYRYSKRPEWATKALYERGLEMATGKLNETIDPGVEKHLVEEAGLSGGTAKFFIKVRLMSPVRSDAGVVGAIVCNHCTVVA